MNIEQILTGVKNFFFSTDFLAKFTLCFIISLYIFIFISILDRSQILKVYNTGIFTLPLTESVCSVWFEKPTDNSETTHFFSLGGNEHKNELLKFQKKMTGGGQLRTKTSGSCEARHLKGSTSIIVKVIR